MNYNFAYVNNRLPWILFLVVAVYSYLKHRSITKAAEDSLKALLGYYMVVIGASAAPYATAAISELMGAAFGIRGGVMNSEVYGALLLMRHGGMGFAVLFLSFGMNLLLARFTSWKGLYLTAHHYLYLSLFTIAMLEGMTRLPLIATVFIGAAVLTLYCWVIVSMTRGAVFHVTGMEGVGMANSSAEAILLGRALGKLPPRSAREYERDTTRGIPFISNVPIAVFAGTLATYLVLCAFAGSAQAHAILGEGSLLLECTVRSLVYAGQISLLMYGIRSLLGNVVEMFWALADRFVPGHCKGLDVSILLSYMPRAWEEGFLFSCLGSLLANVVMIWLKAPFVPIVSYTSAYFPGGAAGVFGYAYGKRRGARLAGFAEGLLATLVMGLMASGLPDAGSMGIMFGETQYGIYGLILEGIVKLLQG